ARLGGQLSQGLLLGADIVGAQAFDDFGLQIGGRSAGQRIDLQAPQPQNQRTQQADLPGPQDISHSRPPDFQPPLHLESLLNGFGRAAHRLGQNVQMFQTDGHFDDKLGVFDIVFGEKAVQQVDAAFVIDLFAGHVRGADLVVDRAAGPADGGGHEVARLDVLDVEADLGHDAERLVAEDQEVVPRRGVAVLGLVDFLVRGIDAHLEHAYQHAAAAGDVVELGFGQIGQVDAIGRAGTD